MLKILKTRWKQKYRTLSYPAEQPALSDRFQGIPELKTGQCRRECSGCAETCPVDAIEKAADGIVLDLGRCIFCGRCGARCPEQAIRFTADHRMAASCRNHLRLDGCQKYQTAKPARPELVRIFRRSVRLRQVSAGGCGACEADINVLNTVVFDLSRFGIQFVASPRHADGLLVTGPVTRNMELALNKTWEATPPPKFVVAVGACAISGGLFSGHPQVHSGTDRLLPVDLYIPGCPPHPLTILHGLLKFFGRKIAMPPQGQKD